MTSEAATTPSVPDATSAEPTKDVKDAKEVSTKEAGKVHNLDSKKEYTQFITGGDGVAVLDAFATWCGPCKMIAPTMDKFSKKYTNARFYKFDVDAVPDLAQELNIRAMPTFAFFKDGELAKTVVGANPKALEAAIVELGGKVEEAPKEESKA